MASAIRKARKDDNHDELVSVFERLGCTVAQMHACGVSGFPDIAVGALGRTWLVELKNPESRYGRAGLNDNQSAFARDWRGGRIYVATNADDVIALVQHWRRAA
jgi:Holliday junction resolvase